MVETELTAHVRECAARSERMEKWLRGLVLGVALVLVEATVRFFFHY